MKRRRPKSAPARVYDDIRQMRPFRRLEAEVAVTLLRTGDALDHRITRALDPLGVSHEQYNALRILRGAGTEGHPTLEISRRLISRSPNITRLLDKLIRKGYARRMRGTRDRRQALVAITPAGRRHLEACDRVIDAVVDRLKGFTRSDMKNLVDLLDRVRDAVVLKTVFEENMEGSQNGG